MRNENLKSNVDKIINCVKDLPYFSKKNLEILGIKNYYLKILLSRMEKGGRIIRLKKGIYVLKSFIDRIKMNNRFSDYLEFIASKMYSPSYLSFEYVLYENNVLTEIPRSFTLATTRKTYILKNKLGLFIYHKIKDELFDGYITEKKGDFLIYKANKVKALFDFLYLRKNIILNNEMVRELRLNIEVFNSDEVKRFKEYVKIEGSKKMRKIYNHLFGNA